jgi:peroxiredoxin
MKFFSLLAATLASTASGFAAITPGTKLPAVEMHSGFPPAMVNMAEHVAGRKVAIIGLPGAFTPT